MYYNSRPSKFENIGEDLVGAKRHQFNTYTDEEQKKREIQKRKRVNTKYLQDLRDLVIESKDKKAFLLLISLRFINNQCPQELETLFPLNKILENLDDYNVVANNIICENSENINALPWGEEKTKALNAVRRYLREMRRVQYYSIEWLIKKYQKKSSKKSELTQVGERRSWNKEVELSDEEKNAVASSFKAIQFGNSVSDKERKYILKELFLNLDKIKKSFPRIDFKELSLCFGSRGKAGSVAFFSPELNVIQVNRNRIGSLVHELAHASDFSEKFVLWKEARGFGSSRNFSNILGDVCARYRKSIRERKNLTPIEKRYFCDIKEIYARAVEASLFDNWNSDFMITKGSMWPVLTDEEKAEVRKTLAKPEPAFFI